MYFPVNEDILEKKWVIGNTFSLQMKKDYIKLFCNLTHYGNGVREILSSGFIWRIFIWNLQKEGKKTCVESLDLQDDSRQHQFC